MRKIVVTEDTFNRLFDKIENDFAYDSAYMRREEAMSDFQQGIRYSMLQKIRGSLKHLKAELERLE